MEALRTLATLLPLSLTSGINLYATVLIAGISIRLGWVQNTPESLDVLASWPVLIAAGVFYLLEFFADKIQFVDNLWDIVHTFIRPVGAIILGIAVLGDFNPIIVVIGALAAGGIALTSHTGKAGSRAALNITSPLENVTNIIISLGEDVFAAAMGFLAIKFPFLASAIAALVLISLVIIIPPLLRWIGFTLTAIFNWLKSLGQRILKYELRSDLPPAAHIALLRHQIPELAARCKAQNIKGASSRSGFVALWGNYLVFTYDKWRQSHVWYIPLPQVVTAYLRRRALIDVLEIHYLDESQVNRVARFAFLKDRTPLAEQIEARLQAQHSPSTP
jgi:hypothetical protein